MKLSGNRLIETIVTQRAKHMVQRISGTIPLTPFTKPATEAVFALLTTAGVHLKSDPAFEVDAGDATVRYIPANTDEQDLMISHTHFDRADADADINCVFPLTRLRELQQEGIIGKVAPTHYGLMGYIPDTKPLLDETIPLILKRLSDEKVDAVIMNPG
jgi:D-proline reductase (dithiol) PrdB